MFCKGNYKQPERDIRNQYAQINVTNQVKLQSDSTTCENKEVMMESNVYSTNEWQVMC